MSTSKYETSVESSVNKNISDTSENQFIKRTKASQKLDIAEKLVEYLNTNQAEKMFSVSVLIEIIANLFPFSYSGAIDKLGFYIEKDKFGGNIIVDFDKRDDTHTNSNIIILGNYGEGKSYLLKFINQKKIF